MKTRGQYRSLGSRTINGKRVAVAEHKLMSYYRIGDCNIPAASLDEAIEKFRACQEKGTREQLRVISEEQIPPPVFERQPDVVLPDGSELPRPDTVRVGTVIQIGVDMIERVDARRYHKRFSAYAEQLELF